MGGALVEALLEGGSEVTALVRGDAAARRLADMGATVVRGDIGQSVYWDRRAEAADVIFHLGLPRLLPPMRGRHLRKAEKEAAAGAEVIREVAAGGDVVMSGCAIATDAGPLALARPALAAEAVLAGPATRVVRLPWAYGPQGFLCDISRGLQMRRFRMVGPAVNHIAVVGARDAADALLAAASAPAGTYTLAEVEPPTQEQLVNHICLSRGAPRPDRLPPAMARGSMGGVFVEAFTADQRVEPAPPPGFIARQRWDRDMMEAFAGG